MGSSLRAAGLAAWSFARSQFIRCDETADGSVVPGLFQPGPDRRNPPISLGFSAGADAPCWGVYHNLGALIPSFRNLEESKVDHFARGVSTASWDEPRGRAAERAAWTCFRNAPFTAGDPSPSLGRAAPPREGAYLI